MNLHNQNIPLSILEVLYDSEANILITEHFILLYHLSKLIDFIHITVQPHWSPNFININQLTIMSVLCYNNIDSIITIIIITVDALICAFFKEVIVISDCVVIIIRVEEKIIIIFRIIISVTIIIVLQTINSIAIIIIMFISFIQKSFILILLYFAKRIFTDFAL